MEIQYDLAKELHIDVMDWFEGRRHWAQLLELIHMLPEHSRYKAKLLADEDLAEKYLDQIEDEPAIVEPSFAGYDSKEQKLDMLLDQVNTLIAVTIAGAGGNPPPVKTVPRPRTGLQKVRSRRRQTRHNTLLAEFGFNTTS